jgi:hypothetical protein
MTSRRISLGLAIAALLILGKSRPAHADNNGWKPGASCLLQTEASNPSIFRAWGQIYNGSTTDLTWISCPILYENDATSTWYPDNVTVYNFNGDSANFTQCFVEGTTGGRAGVFSVTGGTNAAGYQSVAFANPLGATKHTWLGMALRCHLSTSGSSVMGFYNHMTN